MNRTLLEQFASEGSAARKFVYRVWRQYSQAALRAKDNHAGMDRFYALPDPWDMNSEREQSRFRQTNALVTALLGRVGTLLEIGCGEGHQSEHLARLCNRLDGVDVSGRAIERAQQRAPQCRFGVGELGALPWAEGERYDLVVACEVLYYLGDIGRAVEAMSQVGRSCLVTFFCPAARIVAEHVEGLPGLRRGWMYHPPYAWLWAFWQTEGSDAPASLDRRTEDALERGREFHPPPPG